jgi:phosphatidylserine synthase
MKTSEKVFTGLVLLVAAVFVCVFIPNLFSLTSYGPDGWGFNLIAVILCPLFVVILGGTASINLKKKNLDTMPTVIQIVILALLFLWFIPLLLAIWGIFLLIRKHTDQRLNRQLSLNK